jgi:hypothetical protein
MAMVPHERSLVNRMQGKPFVLLGVNCDGEDSSLKKAVADSQITWRSFVETADNPISASWQVQGLPSIILIDARGVIRERILGAPQPEILDAKVEALVRDMQSKNNRPS